MWQFAWLWSLFKWYMHHYSAFNTVVLTWFVIAAIYKVLPRVSCGQFGDIFNFQTTVAGLVYLIILALFIPTNKSARASIDKVADCSFVPLVRHVWIPLSIYSSLLVVAR